MTTSAPSPEPEPATSAAPTNTSAAPPASMIVPLGVSSNKVLVFVMVAAVLILSVFTVGVLVLKRELDATRLAQEQAVEWTRRNAEAALRYAEESQRLLGAQLVAAYEQTDAIRDIGPMQPPSNDKIFTNLGKGMGVSENVVRTGQVGTTAQSAFVTDLTAVQQTDAWTQEIIIRNRDDATTPAQNLCFFPLTWASAGANCNAKCVAAAATMTCPVIGGAGAATDGSLVPTGNASHRRYDGTSCLCIVGSAAGTDYQTERVVR